MTDNTRVILTVPFRVVEAEPNRSKHIQNIAEDDEKIVITFGKTEMEDDGMYDDEDKKSKNADTDIYIEGPVSSGMRDRDGDIVEPEAVMAAWEGYKMNPIIRYNHGRNGIGIMESVRMGKWPGIDHEVPIGKARIDSGEKDIVRKIQKGILRAFSIGFIARAEGVKQECDPENEKDCWYRFTKIEWIETSVVDVPANPVSLFDVVKGVKMYRPGSTDTNSENLINPFSAVVFQTPEEKHMTQEEIMTPEEDEVVADVNVDNVPEPETPTNYEILYEEVQALKDLIATHIVKSDDGEEEELPEDEPAEEPGEAEEELAEDESAEEETTEEEATEEEATEEATEEEVLEEEGEKSVDDITILKARIAELEAEKANQEQEAAIEAEVNRRVKAHIEGEPVVAETPSTPTRKSMRDDTPQVISDEKSLPSGKTAGEIAAAEWLNTILVNRGNM